jgi:hypothetical protein
LRTCCPVRKASMNSSGSASGSRPILPTTASAQGIFSTRSYSGRLLRTKKVARNKGTPKVGREPSLHFHSDLVERQVVLHLCLGRMWAMRFSWRDLISTANHLDRKYAFSAHHRTEPGSHPTLRCSILPTAAFSPVRGTSKQTNPLQQTLLPNYFKPN